MNHPKVSVIVPIYNAEKYLHECLDSVVGQTLENIEIILINDGSTDSSPAIVDDYSAKDSRITVLHTRNQKNLLARKAGIELATGQYTCFVDSDDCLTDKDSIKAMVGLMEQHGKDIIQFSISVEGIEDSKPVSDAMNWNKVIPAEITSSKSIMEACFVNDHHNWVLWNKLFKTAVCQKAFRQIASLEIQTAEDAYLYFLICYHSHSFKSIGTEPLYTYRIGSGTTTKEKIGLEDFKKDCQESLIISNLESFLEKENALEVYKPVLDALKSKLLKYAINQLLRLGGNSREKGKEIIRDFYNTEDFSGIYDGWKYLKYKLFNNAGLKRYDDKYRFHEVARDIVNGS